jgi:hypothetical protein
VAAAAEEKEVTIMAPPGLTLSSLPDEILTNILERVSRRHWQTSIIQNEGVQGLKCVSKKWRDIINQQEGLCQQDLLVVLCIHDRQFRVALGEFSSCRTRLIFKLQPHRGLIVSEDDHIFQVGFQGKNVLVINHCPNGHCVSMSKHRWLSNDLDQPKGWCAYVNSRSEQASRSEVSDSFSWRAGSGFGPWDRICVQEDSAHKV